MYNNKNIYLSLVSVVDLFINKMLANRIEVYKANEVISI